MSERHPRSPEETVARVPIACTHCRKRKVKCVTQSCQVVCLRCERNGLHCEYVASDRQARFIGSSQGQSSYTPPSSSKQAQQSHNNSSFHSAPPSSDPHPRINTNVSGLYRPAHQRSPMAPIYSPSSSLDMQHHPPETQLVVGSITATRSATPQSRGDQPIAQNDHTTSYPYSQQGVATAYPESYEASYSNPGYYCEYPYPCAVCYRTAPCYCGALGSWN